MSQNEFLSTMRSALSGKVPANIIEENIRYYEDYIGTQMRQGKTEAEVLDALGDPRLLARTIIEANKHAEGTDSYSDGRTEAYEYDEQTSGKEKGPWLFRFLQTPKWLQLLVIFLVAFVVIGLVGTILGALLPFIIIGFLIAFLIRMFK